MQFIWNKRRQRCEALQWLVRAGLLLGLGAARSPAVDQPPSDGTPPPADAAQMTEELSRYMSQVRQGTCNDSELYPLSMRHGPALLPHLKTYAKDPNTRVAHNATRSMGLLLQHTPNPSDRQKVTDCLLEMCKENYEQGLGLDVGHYLLAFAKTQDFSSHAKQMLQELMSHVPNGTYKHPGYVREIILLVGIANMQSELPRLQELIDRWDEGLRQKHQRNIDKAQEDVDRRPKFAAKALQNRLERLRKTTYWQNSALWDAWRARARMGVKEDILHCIEMVESYPDPLHKAARLFKELAYIRQPEVVTYLQKYLYLDERPAPLIGDAIVYSYAAYAAAGLLEMLEDAPVRPYSMLRDDAMRLRDWMEEQTEWKIVR